MRLATMALMLAASTVTAKTYHFEGVPLEIPAPIGVVSTSAYPALWDLATRMVSPRSILIDHFIDKRSAPESTRAATWEATTWALIQTPRGTRDVELSKEKFEKLKAETKVMDFQASIERKYPGVLQSIGIQGIKMMGVNADTDEWLMFSAASKIQTDAGDMPVISVTSYCRVKGKLVMLNSYRVFHTPKDIEIVQSEARTWALSVLNANR